MLEKGKKINDRYEIISPIGEGGMANVYLAKDLILERKVAVKVLRSDLENNEKFVRKFEREAVAASNLNHPNIVSIYDVLQENNKHYIIMEYIEGITLKQLLRKRKKLTIPEVIDIMVQLTSGITHAHSSYIIHRDIKPQNIMILDNGLVKIADFGIAASLNEAELTQTNSVMGSVYYLPPEQASGTVTSIKSDIYSLGIVMYELLTGTIPFKGENVVEIAMKHIQEALPSVRKTNPLIPQSIENIILKATAKNMKNRYESASEMEDDLRTCLNEDKINENKYIYKYKEFDGNTTKVMPAIKVKDTKQTFVEETVILEKEEKSNKKIFIILGIISALILSVVLFLLIGGNKTKDILVPSVKNMSILEAEKTLREYGFEVNIEIKRENNDEISEGKVIKTEPSEGRTIKKGTVITIYESLGTENITLEDFINKSYEEASIKLQALGIEVIKEYKDIDNVKDYEKKENIIIDQNPKKDTKLKKGDKVYLYLPKIVPLYPDMVNEEWTRQDVEKWVVQYNLMLTIEEVPVYVKEKDGKVINQSRQAETKIVNNTTFKVKIGKYEEKVEKPSEEEKDEETN